MTEVDEGTNVEIPIQHIRDFAFFGNQWFDPKKIEASLDYKPKDGDIILSSYPKTGTTWMQYIIWQVLHKGESFPSFGDIAFKSAPFMELSGIEPIECLPFPRFYKNHFPFQMMNINKKAKYICIHRHPQDVIISYYHFANSLCGRPLKLDQFFDDFLEGRLPYGDYFDHVLSFYSQKDEPNVHLVSYEELFRATETQILRLARFLGEEYHQALLKDGNAMRKILDQTSFSYMKEHLETYVFEEKDGIFQRRDLAMFRKGVVGDGKKVLSQEQIHKLNQKARSKLMGTDLLQFWSS